MNNPVISRRTLLRGLGTAMALPALEAMLPITALAQSGKKAARVNRMVFMFVPNGINMKMWTPTTEGAFELTPTLAPLKKVKNNLTVLTGLTQQNAFALGDGGGDHARSAAAFLTGCHPRKTDGADIKAGISADQLAAMHVGNKTFFPSLEIGCERSGQSGNCDSGYSCAYSSNIAWRGEASPVAKELDPRLVFERLFSNGNPGDTKESIERRRIYRHSILDSVVEDATRLKNRLGTRDQGKLDEYFSSVREIEHRLEWAEKSNVGSKISADDRPNGVPSDFGEHIRLLGDMMILAFQADLTRICTFMVLNDGNNRSYKEIGVPEGHHDCSHHGGNAEKLNKVQQINQFHTTQLAYILEKMQSIKETEGSMLDNTMFVFGAGISDGDAHNHDNLPILLAGGGAGTIKPGHHKTYKNGTPMTNLFLSMLDRMGVPAEKIGDSSGKLDMLF